MSHYKVLHEYQGENQYLVLNEVTNTVCLRKVLDIFDTVVFDYLKSNHNIHIPVIYDYYEEDGKLYVFEEHIQGTTLNQLVKQSNLTNKEKIKLMDELCEALTFLHSAPHPIIHRDLKPSNIMIDKNGVLKLIDYDAAKIYKDGEMVDTVLIGTKGSAAPEQYGFGQSDIRTDIYGAGKLLEFVFPGDRYMQAVAAKATQIDPANRYQTINAFNRAIHRKPIPYIPLIASVASLLAVTSIMLSIISINAMNKTTPSGATAELTDTSLEESETSSSEAEDETTTVDSTDEDSFVQDESVEESDASESNESIETADTQETTGFVLEGNDELPDITTSTTQASESTPSSTPTMAPTNTPAPTTSPTPTPEPVVYTRPTYTNTSVTAVNNFPPYEDIQSHYNNSAYERTNLSEVSAVYDSINSVRNANGQDSFPFLPAYCYVCHKKAASSCSR